MARLIDETGNRYGRLTVISRTPKNKQKQKEGTCWIVRCSCGRKTTVLRLNLKNGSTKSCGCLRKEIIKKIKTKHGFGSRDKITPEYRAWNEMKRRCKNKNCREYERYGKRGITIEERWNNSFLAFFNEVGRRPSSKHSLDRIDNEKGYFPGNVRWATTKQQSRNRRNNHYITIGSETKVLVDWVEFYKTDYSLIQNRLSRGWKPLEALTTQKILPTASRLNRSV